MTVHGIVDAHGEQFTLGLVEEAGTDLNERIVTRRSPGPLSHSEGLRSCSPASGSAGPATTPTERAMPAATTPARIVDERPAARRRRPTRRRGLTREAQAQDDGANSCNEERSVDHRVTAVAEEHGEHEDRGGRGDGLGHRPESERSPVGEDRSPPERKPCRGDEAPEGLDRCLLEFEGVPRRFEVGAQQIQRLAGRDD